MTLGDLVKKLTPHHKSEGDDTDVESKFQQLDLKDQKAQSDPLAVHAAQTAVIGSITRSQKEREDGVQSQDSTSEANMQQTSPTTLSGHEQQTIPNTLRGQDKSHDLSGNVSQQTSPTVLRSQEKSVTPSNNSSSNASTARVNSNKALPNPPNEMHDRERASTQERPVVGSVDSDLPTNPDTVTTDMYEPVVQETIHVQNIRVEHDVVERDIHQDHEVTKIQPIIERVNKPARHFILTEDGREVEISASDAAALDRADNARKAETAAPAAGDLDNVGIASAKLAMPDWTKPTT